MERARYRPGQKLDDLCRACKLLRVHTVFAAGPDGEPLRVVCDYCGSQHNYRGGERAAVRPATAARQADPSRSEPFATVTERERSGFRMSEDTVARGEADLESMLRKVIREESGLSPVVPAERWRGGDLVLRPGRPGLQEKSWPIETFFHKIVMLRNRLRVLEQQINSAELPADLKLKLQAYVTGCYGTLTSFNVLFADDADRFRGSSKD